MNNRKAKLWIIPISITVIILVILFATGILWRDSILERYTAIPKNNDLSVFVDKQEGLELLAVFVDPSEIEDGMIDNKLYDSYLMQSLINHSNAYQVNYLFKTNNDAYGIISYIKFENESDATQRFENLLNISSENSENVYATATAINLPGEPQVNFFLPTFVNRGYISYDEQNVVPTDLLNTSFWFHSREAINIRMTKSVTFNDYQTKLMNFCKEN